MTNNTLNEGLNQQLNEILNHLPNLSIVRNTTETVVSKIEFDFKLEEQFPFLKNLFDDIEILFEGTLIKIYEIQHHSYRERYKFERNTETVCLDFEYNNTGFFGRVVPIQKLTNSELLYSDIKKILLTLKEEEDAS
jgi:hypothetical protein